MSSSNKDTYVPAEYQSPTAVREVLGCLLQQPSLLTNHSIDSTDFPEAFHKVIFKAIYNLYALGAVKFTPAMVSEYLEENNKSVYLIYSSNHGQDYVTRGLAGANLENFEMSYTELRKFSVLRDFKEHGVDVSDLFDPHEVDPEKADEKRKIFNELDISELIQWYRRKVIDIMERYSPRNDRTSVKAGGLAAKEQKELWKESPAYGLSYASNYQTTITMGMRPRKFTVISAPTGLGKSRVSVANLCHSFVPKYWDADKEKFVPNPHGEQNSVLYIGTEMELVEEIEPILWSYVADVPQDHILFNAYGPGEEERVDQAIDIINSGNIYLEYMPDYDITKLEQVIEEHVVKHNVRHVYFDYIHITTDLISEFQHAAKAHIQIREDQVLGNLATRLKDLCNKFDISIDTWTQVSGDWKNSENRDQTIVRGAKSIIDKVDIGAIMTRPTAVEKKNLEKILRSGEYMGKPEPNVCLTYYKNRGGKYNNIKVWLYIDYSTMRVHDMFCTDKDCNLISDITPTFTQIVEDKLVVVNCKDQIIIDEDDIIEPYHTVSIPTDNADYFTENDKKEERIKKKIEEMTCEQKSTQTGHFEVIEDESINNTESEDDSEEEVLEKLENNVLTETANDDDIIW